MRCGVNKTGRLRPCAALLAGALCLTSVLPALSVRAAEPSTQSDSSLEQLRTLSKASQELYSQISPSLVRIRTEASPVHLLPPSLRREFNEWRRSLPRAEGNPEVSRRNEPPSFRTATQPSIRPLPEPGANAAGPSARTELGAGRSELMLLRTFVEQRLSQNSDPVTFSKMRVVLQRIDAVREGQAGEVVAAVFDNQGHAVALSPLFTDERKTALPALLPNGNPTTASILGNDFLHGISVLKVENANAVKPIARDNDGPNPAELLLAISGYRGAPDLVLAGPMDQSRRFVIGSDERAPQFLFSTECKLSALYLDRQALPLEAIWPDVDSIVASGRPVKRPELGVQYSLVPQGSPLRASAPALGARPALHVDNVLPGSPAARAGLQRDDFILTLANQPIVRLNLVFEELGSKPTVLPMGILRGDQEMTLQLSLEWGKQEWGKTKSNDPPAKVAN